MTGEEFKAIRKYNRVSQRDLIGYLSYRSRYPIYELEKDEKVPEKFVRVLENLIGVKVSDPEIAKSYFEELPEKWKKPVTRKKNNFFAGKTILYPEGAIL
jgi:transcriptional regulator with XRE-family HTH domain